MPWPVYARPDGYEVICNSDSWINGNSYAGAILKVGRLHLAFGESGAYRKMKLMLPRVWLSQFRKLPIAGTHFVLLKWLGN